jgi:hypothetical protein
MRELREIHDGAVPRLLSIDAVFRCNVGFARQPCLCRAVCR